MFNFSRDDSSYSRLPTYRLSNHKHNPYVGSFHTVNRELPKLSNVIDSKSPLLPMFRHSPPSILKSLGLKGLLNHGDLLHKPVLTQVQIQQEIKQTDNKRNVIFPNVLKNLPLSIFDTSSSVTSSLKDDDLPLCSICLECFKDGDELRTLTCCHIYHRKCIDIWLLGCLSDSDTDTYNCPQCRKCVTDNIIDSNQIPSTVFISIGKSLTDKNIEALSDISDDDSPRDLSITPDSCDIPNCNQSNASISDLLISDKLQETLGGTLDIDDSHIPIPGQRNQDQGDPICGSVYSDCGFPLV